jgi:hypothetical protein
MKPSRNIDHNATRENRGCRIQNPVTAEPVSLLVPESRPLANVLKKREQYKQFLLRHVKGSALSQLHGLLEVSAR